MDRERMNPLMSPCMIDKQWLIKSKIGNIEDDYEFDSKKDNLGEGSYGIVYKAIMKSTGQIRAIKCINKSRVKHQERLKNEIEIMSTLDHPNIIRLYETYEDQKNIYLVIEYCEGGELFDRIAERGYYTEQEAVVLFRQIMSAINYCHSRKICHRDLKPENFLFCTKDDNSIIKVIDFGLSKTYGVVPDSPLKKKTVNPIVPAQTSNIMKTRAGTPYYIAPEVLDGKYDEKCDIWSAGVTLYIILCGYPPFYGETDKEILMAVKKGEYEYDGEEWDIVSDECKNLIKKLLSKPEFRFNSEMVMASKWMQKNQPLLQNQHKIPFQKVKQWNTYPKLKKLALNYIASQLTMQQIQPIVKQFLLIDRDYDGCLTLQEVINGTQDSENPQNQEIIKQTFKSFISYMPNKIAFTDFVALVMDSNIYLKENVIRSAFRIFDKNGIGKISPNHLHELFFDNAYYAKKKIDYWVDMVKCCDFKNDGVIDYEEFSKMVFDQDQQVQINA